MSEGLIDIPQISNGEIFTGYLSQHRDRPETQLLKDAYGSQNRSWALPTDLARQVGSLGKLVGPLNRVLANNTLLPGYTRFLSHTEADLVRTHHIGDKVRSAPGLVGFLRPGRMGPNWAPGVCLKCLDEDISLGGQPFWRRDFVLSHVKYCAWHGTPIHSLCTGCFSGNRTFVALTGPSSKCLCGEKLKPRDRIRGREEKYLEFDMSFGWSKLLDPTFLPHVKGPEIACLIHKIARELGLAGPNSVNWVDFRKFYSTPEFAKVGDSIAFPLQSRTTLRAMLGEAPLRNPFNSLFLLITMFGAWKGVESALRSMQPAENLPEVTPRQPLQLQLEVGQSRRQCQTRHLLARSIELLPETCVLYRQIRVEHPLFSHSAIVRHLPSINQHAATKERLRAHGLECIPQSRGHQYSAEIDAALAKYISQQWRSLTKARVKFRLTRLRLMHGHTFGNKNWVYCHRRMPKTAETLDKYAETKRMRMLRVLKFEIRAGMIRGYGEADARRLHLMNKTEIRDLKNRKSNDRLKKARASLRETNHQ
jgi:hypothetical protein